MRPFLCAAVAGVIRVDVKGPAIQSEFKVR